MSSGYGGWRAMGVGIINSPRKGQRSRRGEGRHTYTSFRKIDFFQYT